MRAAWRRFSISTLAGGCHAPVTASYGGDTSFNVSTSAAVSQVVNKATSTTALLAAPNPSTFGQSVTFTATVTGPGGTPDGDSDVPGRWDLDRHAAR